MNNDPEQLELDITDDETQVYGYNVKTKAQSTQCVHLESPRQNKSSFQLLGMFTVEGVIPVSSTPSPESNSTKVSGFMLKQLIQFVREIS